MEQTLFKKYPSISNDYRDSYIKNWLKMTPELEFEDFILTEKINGANFQILITKDDIFYGKRTELLDDSCNFYGHKKVMENYQDMISDIKEELLVDGVETVRLFGELYGANISLDMDYGKEKGYKVFDIEVDNETLTPEQIIDILTDLGYPEHYAPIVGIVKGIKKALNFNIRFNTTLYDKDTLTEGIVIKPYKKIYSMGNVQQFTIKLKNKEFLEVRPKEKEEVIYSDNFKRVEAIYIRYLSENRLHNMFSKLGPIEKPSQMFEYRNYMSKDAQVDFKREYMDDFLSVDDKERGKIFRCDKDIINKMLIDYLERRDHIMKVMTDGYSTNTTYHKIAEIPKIKE